MINEEINFPNAKMLREKAENKLKEKGEKEDRGLMKTGPHKLLHQLQVHQIELEMQNEELRQANETAEAALKKYTMLFDLSPLGYFFLDSDGTICDLNFTGADMLDERRFSLVNSNFKLFISEEYKPLFNDFLKKIFTSSAKESCEVFLGYDNKPLCRAYMEGVVVEGQHRCLLSVVDISKLSNV
ncbi:MAG: PAS domain-containing protein [Bacteroidales bacterium]|nr:PAS domain-containing protein [Bacteroidales bacterium]